jgi:hypothetical protein
LTVLAVFGHFLKGKPGGLTGKGLAGTGTGQIFLPGGYPGYSLELSKLHARRQPKARFVVLSSDLEWPDVQAQLKVKAIDVLFPQQAAVNDAAFEIEFSIAQHVPTPLPLLSENDYKYLVQNALKLKANPAVKITIKEVAVNGGVLYFYLQR